MNIETLLENNRAWAEQMTSLDPEFFSRLEHQQRPRFLWIGCSDSRVPANQITGLPPGQVFVHRNIANQVIHTDFNALSVIQYAVEFLEVEHIIVCGHYGCSGIRAALERGCHGFVDNWLRHITDIHTSHSHEFDHFSKKQESEDHLTELNVIHQVVNVAESSFVEQAWEKGRTLAIHGWVYSLADGIIRDMKVSIASNEELQSLKGRS